MCTTWVSRCMLCATVSWHMKPVCGNTISLCMCTLCVVVHSENRNWCGNTVSTLICTLCTILHREKRKLCGNIVILICTLCAMLHRETCQWCVATLSVHVYARCLQCYIVKHVSGVWQHCQYTYMHAVCRTTSWNMSVVCGNTVSTRICTLFAVLHRETWQWCVATLSVLIYALCCATSWNMKVVWQHCQYTYMHAKKVECGNTVCTRTCTPIAVLHRETWKWFDVHVTVHRRHIR
jgi:hypothetical protein